MTKKENSPDWLKTPEQKEEEAKKQEEERRKRNDRTSRRYGL